MNDTESIDRLVASDVAHNFATSEIIDTLDVKEESHISASEDIATSLNSSQNTPEVVDLEVGASGCRESLGSPPNAENSEDSDLSRSDAAPSEESPQCASEEKNLQSARNIMEPFEEIYSPYIDECDHTAAGLEGFHVMESLKNISFTSHYRNNIKTIKDHLSEIIRLYKEIFQPAPILDVKTMEDVQRDILTAQPKSLSDLMKNMKDNSLRKILEAEENKKDRLERFPFLMDLCFSYYILIFDPKAPFIKFPNNIKRVLSYVKLLHIESALDLSETFEHLYNNKDFMKLCFSAAPIYIIEDTTVDAEISRLISFKDHIKVLINLLIRMSNIRAKKQLVDLDQPIMTEKDMEDYDKTADVQPQEQLSVKK